MSERASERCPICGAEACQHPGLRSPVEGAGGEERWTIQVCDEHGPVGVGRCPVFHGLTREGADRAVFTREVEVVPASLADSLASENRELRERVKQVEAEARWNAAEFVCESCRRAVSYESRLPGLRCALCPHCGDGTLSSASARAARYREALERIVATGLGARTHAEIRQIARDALSEDK